MNNVQFKISDLALINLLPPAAEAKSFLACYYQKVNSPSLVELLLASRKHRWPKVQKLNVQFFENIGDKVGNFQNDVFKLFKLPPVKMIQDSLGNLEWKNPGGKFQFNKDQEKAYVRIISEFQKDLIGDGKLIKQLDEEISIYEYFMLAIYSVGLAETLKGIIKNRPEYISNEALAARALSPQLENYYLQAMIKNGTERIKTTLGNVYKKETLKALTDMIKQGKSPYDVGRYLYKTIGEGKLWYWNRIARSESTLALNAAFQAQARAVGVPYERWSAASTACDICKAFDGKMWRLGEGPEPVESTHPHCLCHKGGRFTPRGEPIQEMWDRASPYDEPYTSREILRLPTILTQRGG